MSEFEMRGKDGETFAASYGGGVPGHVLITVSDNYEGCNGFLNAADTRKFAEALLRIADESER